ncbi:MAG: hypothetical protein ROW52_09180 [Anaerolineaceae bacterium]|jgi:hypothetical protein
MESWKTKTLIIGGLIGLLVGVAGAYLLVQKAEDRQEIPQLTAGQGLKLGLGVMGLLRLVQEFTSEK